MSFLINNYLRKERKFFIQETVDNFPTPSAYRYLSKDNVFVFDEDFDKTNILSSKTNIMTFEHYEEAICFFEEQKNYLSSVFENFRWNGFGWTYNFGVSRIEIYVMSIGF